MKRTLLLLLFSYVLFASTNCFAQDLIVKYDSTKLFCKIIKEDYRHIYFINKGNSEQSIAKEYVIKYYNHVLGIMQFGMAINTNKPIKDSAGYKKDSLLFLGGHKFLLADEPLRFRHVRKLVGDNTLAISEMNKAEMINALSFSSCFIAGAFLADFISSALKNQINWGVGAASIVFLIIGVTIEQNYQKHVARAVKLYNAKMGVAATKPKFQLGVASTGVGISLKF